MHIVCVCTGNTCRSPMAEGLLRTMLTASGHKNIRVSSAGFAADGSKVCDNAVTAMAALGIDIANHYSTPLTKEVFESADMFLVMSPAHAQTLQMAGADSARIRILGGGIPDPYGGSLAVYEATRDRLSDALEAFVSTIPPHEENAI